MSNATIASEKKVVSPEIIKTEIVLSSAELESEREKYLKKIQKNIELPGFRPGKAPLTIIKKKYNNTAFFEGFEHLLKEKTNDILKSQVQKPLYYVYDFETTGVIEDNGTDKKIGIEILLEPQVDIDVKNAAVEFVKYGFTEGQKKIFSDIITLFNFLNENPAESINVQNEELFIITTELELPSTAESEEEQKKKESTMPLVLHPLQYQSYGLNELLPTTLQKNSTYNLEIDKWITILEKNFPDKKLGVLDFLKKGKENNVATLNITIKDIQQYKKISSHLNNDRIKMAFGLKDEDEINQDILYTKLFEVADIVADYFSGNENIKRGNAFINNLIQIELPEDFVTKLYNNYVKEDDRKYFTIDYFKQEIIKQIENNILKNILPNTFDTSVQLEELATNVAKSYLVETLLTQMYLFDLNSTKNYVLYTLQSSDSQNRERLLENYYNKDAVFSFPKKFAQDVTVTTKLENINAINFSNFFGINEEIFN
ncbi:MAG: hypothetical protein KatS3mg027_2279 [Bacteroidia bacterium]|nr:MAG: hypothetical protein KatS3mg027_2279 [Bacteroidia bacterium]